jgi:hypothetical protein
MARATVTSRAGPRRATDRETFERFAQEEIGPYTQEVGMPRRLAEWSRIRELPDRVVAGVGLAELRTSSPGVGDDSRPCFEGPESHRFAPDDDFTRRVTWL